MLSRLSWRPAVISVLFFGLLQASLVARAARPAPHEAGPAVAERSLYAVYSPDSVSELGSRLARRGVGDLYLKFKGKIADEEVRAALAQLRAKASKARIHEWLGFRVCGSDTPPPCHDLGNPGTPEQRFLGLVAKSWELGFDGVHLDLEPVSSGDLRFVERLRKVQAAKPAGRLVSVAGAALALPEWSAIPYAWRADFFAQVLAVADQLIVMSYDTALVAPEAYRKFMATQVRASLELAGELAGDAAARLRIGIPTYEQGREGVFHPDVENAANAIAGIRAGLPPGEEIGIAIFVDHETAESEWETIAER